MSDTVPANLEAEQAVLGAIFIDPTKLTDVALIITEARMFYRRSHQHIYAAILALREYGSEIDWIHVAQTIAKAGHLEECGGKEMLDAYLSEISHAVPSAYGAEGYATMVRDKYALREIGFSGREIDKLSHDPTKSPQEIIEVLERKVVALDAISTSTSLERIGDHAQAMVTEQAERKALKESSGLVIAGVSSGFADMDAYTGGWKGGEFIGLGARPGEGKTSLLLDVARRNMELEEPVPGLIISLEMPRRTLRYKMMCNVAKVDTLAPMNGTLTDAEEWEWEQAAEKIATWPLYVERGRRGMTMRAIRSKCYQAVERFKVRFVMIDYLQYIKKRWFRMDTFEHVSECSRACKTLAGELDIPVIAAIQLKRQEKRRGKEPPPSLDSFRNSGDIEQDLDGAWMIFTRQFHKGKPCDVDLIAAKTRLGMTGTVAMLFDRRTGRFEQAPVGANDAAYSAYTEKEAPEPAGDPPANLQKPSGQVPTGVRRADADKQVLKPGAEDDPRKEVPKEEAREMFKTKEQGGKAVRV